MKRCLFLVLILTGFTTAALAHVKMPKDPPSALANPLDGRPSGVMYYTGYSHVDFNWLWDWPDTIHTWDSTAQTALNLMYRFPDYHFGQTQAAAYLSMERIRPDVFKEIQMRVQDGSWSLLGGMWAESDTNLPSGEGIARTFLYGQNYFQEKFGKISRVGFLPDTFGHTWQLPQILKQTGIDYFYFQRCPRNKHLFWWESPDGSKVLSYSSPGWYNDRVGSTQKTWPNTILSESGVNIAMCVFGVGNHGGGPTIEDLKAMDTLKNDPEFPVIVEGGPEAFFQACLAERTDFPTFREELQYTFEGCYTSKGDIKRLLRDSENELYVAETLSTLANLNGLDYPSDDLRYGWRHSAFNHFHDIAPGTAIHSTYEEAANKQKLFKQIANKVISNAWSTLEKKIPTEGEGQPLTVFNPVAWTRTDAVETSMLFDTQPPHLRVTDPGGVAVPVQILSSTPRDGKYEVKFVFVAESMPSLGYRVYRVASADAPTMPSDPLTMANNTITTPRFIVGIDSATGQVNRLFDRTNNREVLPSGQRALRFVALGERSDNSAWTISLNGTTTYLDTPLSYQVLERGPVRARVRASYKYGSSTLTQDILVYRNIDRVDAPITVDFQDYDVLLKSEVPAALTNSVATFDIPYATIQRPADGKVDVPMQKWVDVSQGTTYGLSVLNDSKYGVDVNGARIRMSLLRGTHSPDTVGDKGFHYFSLALYPHTGDWKQAGTMRRGYEFNLPLRVMPVTIHAGEWGAEKSFLSTNMPNIAVTALKKSEDGNGYVIRFYEYEGNTRTGTITLPAAASMASPVDILERPIAGSVSLLNNQISLQARPSTIHTVRVVQ